jgi:signal transduction histidine kinase
VTTTVLVSAVVAVVVVGAAVALYAVARARERNAVRRVSEAVDDIAAGNFARRVTLPGHGELSELAGAVNRLAEEMQAARAQSLRREEAHRQLISNLSHDLRTPITSIAGYVDALQRGIGEDSARHMEIIAAKTAELTRLADDLFYLTRLDSGDLELDLQPTDAGEVARECLLGFEQELRSRDIDVVVDIPDVVCPVVADEAALGRIVGNFIANSLKHARSMTRLGIDVGSDGTSCAVTVWDDGEGFSKGVVELIERGASVGPGGGSGLGLSIAHDLSGRMHATVEAHSEPRVRTAVTISLPLLEMAEAAPEQDV